MGLTSTFTPILLIGYVLSVVYLVTCGASQEHSSTRLQPKRSPTGRKLLHHLNYDEDAQAHWKHHSKFPTYVYNEEVDISVRVFCRDMEYRARTRVYKILVDPTVEDIMVKDVETGHKVLADNEEDREAGKQRAFDAMVEYLMSLGIIQGKSCPVPHFSFPLRANDVQACPPGFNISCDSKCSFDCGDSPMNLLVGVSTLTCQDDGTFTKPFPTCKAVRCQVPSYTDHARSHCKSGALVDVNTTCAFECDPGYRITGSSTLTCNTDGVFSGYIPHCQETGCQVPFLPSRLRSDCIPTSSMRVNATCTFTCDPGFTLSGRPTLTCLGGDIFSDSLPACQPNGEATRTPEVTLTPEGGTGQGGPDQPSAAPESAKNTITKDVPGGLGYLGCISLIILLLPAAFIVRKIHRRRSTIQYDPLTTIAAEDRNEDMDEY